MQNDFHNNSADKKIKILSKRAYEKVNKIIWEKFSIEIRTKALKKIESGKILNIKEWIFINNILKNQ